MAAKFDSKTTKHQLFHLSISLAAVLVCTIYMHYRQNWTHVGRLWDSLIVPLVFLGEICKVILARFYTHTEDECLTQKQGKKQLSYFAPREVLGGLMLQLFCIVLYAFICIILGAPVLHNYEQTFVLSLLLTLLTVSPTIFLLGGGRALQVCFCEKPDFITKSEDTALNLFKYNALGGILGAWSGSVVLPLDWERNWQIYPIPNVIGALFGSALGSVYACILVLCAIAKTYLKKRN